MMRKPVVSSCASPAPLVEVRVRRLAVLAPEMRREERCEGVVAPVSAPNEPSVGLEMYGELPEVEGRDDDFGRCDFCARRSCVMGETVGSQQQICVQLT